MFNDFCQEMKAFVNQVPRHLVDGVPGNFAPLYMQLNALGKRFEDLEKRLEMMDSQHRLVLKILAFLILF